MLELNASVRKCGQCNYVADDWDSICKVDKSHETFSMWQYLNTDTNKYEYYNSPLLGMDN